MRYCKIVVLLSTYNGEKYLNEQIDSILNQKNCGIVELVVRDDGSTDNTIKILEEYKRKGMLTYIEGNNIGYVGSFFELLKYAYEHLSYCDYFSLSDQDDVWDEDKLSVAVDNLEKKNSDIPLLYGSASKLVDENLNFIRVTQQNKKSLTFYNSIIQNFMPGHSQVMNLKLLEILCKNSDYTKVYVHDSYILNCAILSGDVIFDNKPHTLYRQHSFNQLGSNKGFVSWIWNRIKRIKKGDGKKYAIQIQYICDSLYEYMSKEQVEEMKKFFFQNNIILRLRYIRNTRLYRQSNKEQLIFIIYYLFGGYKLD